MELKGYEVKELLKSPEALTVLIDYHAQQEAMADAMDHADSARYHKRRHDEFFAARIKAETERAERVSRQPTERS